MFFRQSAGHRRRRVTFDKQTVLRHYSSATMMDAESIFYAVLAFSWVEYLWEAYLGARQRTIYRTRTTVPSELKDIVDAETFSKARTYALDKSSFGAFEGLFSHLLSTAIMWFYGFKVVWDWAGKFRMIKYHRIRCVRLQAQTI